MGEVTKTERIFISPHFCLENLPSKFLPCKLTLWGEEVKMLASPQRSIWIFTDILPSKIAVVNACGRWYIIKSSNKGSCYGNKRY